MQVELETCARSSPSASPVCRKYAGHTVATAAASASSACRVTARQPCPNADAASRASLRRSSRSERAWIVRSTDVSSSWPSRPCRTAASSCAPSSRIAWRSTISLLVSAVAVKLPLARCADSAAAAAAAEWDGDGGSSFFGVLLKKSNIDG